MVRRNTKTGRSSADAVAGLIDSEAEPEEEPDLPLVGMQPAFVFHYCKHFNATKAAKEAGHSENSARSIGSENLTKPAIRAAIKKRLDELDEETKVTAGWIRERLIQNIDRASEAEPVFDKQGKELGIIYQGAVVNKALELLGRNAAMFQDKVDHTTQGDKLAQVFIYPSNGREIDPEDDDGS